MIQKFAWVLVFLIAACAPQPLAVIVRDVPAENLVRPIFIGTTRRVDADGRPALGTASAPVSFAQHLVSFPPGRPSGSMPMARGTPDPARHFAIEDIKTYPDQAAFSHALAATLAERPRGARTVLVFVHGFYVTFAEGLFRTAQFAEDLDIAHVPAHFSWPSTLSPAEYRKDRTSALMSRSAFVQFLDAIVAGGAEKIVIVAHSLGAQLVTEALKDATAEHRTRLLDRIGGVFFVAPDIGVDQFRAGLRAMSPRPEPFVVFSSRIDWLLRLSAAVAGQPERLGNLSDPAELEGLGVLFIDLTQYREGYMNHRVPFSSPGVIAALDEWRARNDDVGRAFRVLVGDPRTN